MTIKEIFSLRAVEEYMLSERTLNKFKSEGLAFSNPDLVVGLELEIEQWPTPIEDCKFTGINFTSDGSLRNSGVELITKPTPIKYIPGLVQRVLNHFDVTEENYSERCSVHVHVNCQNLTIDELKTLFVVYQSVERVLFGFIGHEREDNIFCVPWYQSGVANNFIQKFLSNPYILSSDTWHKYCALNLLPLREQGTVEFRHMEGTCDVERITLWLNLIGRLFKYSLSTDYEQVKKQILHLNTVSNYREYILDVFGEYADAVTSNENFEHDLSMGVVDCKLSLMENKKQATWQPSPAPSALDEFMRPRTVYVDPSANWSVPTTPSPLEAFIRQMPERHQFPVAEEQPEF